MGKIAYRPKKDSKGNYKKNKNEKKQPRKDKIEEIQSIEIEEVLTESKEDNSTENTMEVEEGQAFPIPNIKAVGTVDCEYHVYLEDYVYTYLYQYASIDLTKESSAVFVGKIYKESKEMVIKGIIPITNENLQKDSEWIDNGVLEIIEEERKKYFKEEEIIGWMHVQPGYGTMLTMKELREHRNVFGENNAILMLVDTINKIETFYIYDEGELKEQTGYYMYYERNEAMQKYMLEHPFVQKRVEALEDNVVTQFREIGKQRKQEYTQRRKTQIAIVATSAILVMASAIIVKFTEKTSLDIPVLAKQENLEPSYQEQDQEQGQDQVAFIIQPPKTSALPSEEQSTEKINQENSTIQKQQSTKQEENIPKQEVVEKEKIQTTKEEYEVYVVKEGDTLANISYNKYNDASKAKEIAKLNGLDDTDFIWVGQKLKVPAK